MMIKRLLLSILLLGSSIYCLTAYYPNEKSDEWELIWEDDFNGNNLDTTCWGYMERHNNDSRRYHSSNPECYGFKNGNIILRGILNNNQQTDTATYLTGAITTKGKLSFAPGRIEIRAKLGSATGAWPAFWMLPYPPDKNWPKNGELDIIEHLNNDDFVYQTIHSDFTKKNPKAKPQRYVKAKYNKNEYNLFQIDFLPDRIDYYINGIRTLHYPKVDSLLNKGQFPFNHEWYLMLDMQLGGKWVGNIDSDELPVEMQIDWVKYYRKKQQ
ncbi:MAG: glycoside hydrolase family 16 protein [Muribaculaceae bacterium]|nr:glycoside hydrolase family 16 protein [Muribaculaceae bacterium]